MKTLLFALGLATLVGCNTTKTGGLFGKDAPAPKADPAPAKVADATPPPPVKPTPPTMLVGPSDVTAGNPYDAAGRLTAELSADSKPSATGPVTVEVSRVKMKQR